MQPVLYFMCLFVWSCGLNQKEIGDKPLPVDSTLTSSKNNANLHQDTIDLNGAKLLLLYQKDQPIGINTFSGDTLIPIADYYHKFTFPDINLDGKNDIRVFIVSNTPNQCDNFFYDPVGSYRKIIGSDLDIERISGSELYYSYNRAGCGDQKWESHLSRIIDFKLEDIGYLLANGCNKEKIDIQVFRMQIGERKLIDSFSIQTDKFQFIKNYWFENDAKFL